MNHARLVVATLAIFALGACGFGGGEEQDAAPPAVAAPLPAPASDPATTTEPAPLDDSPGKALQGPAPGFRMLAGNVIQAKDTLAALRARHGETNVVATKVPGAEGEEFDGWVLFPEDATRRLHVYLDGAGAPEMARVLDRESGWQRTDGIRMGLTLTELARRNGAPVGFMGFDWDYGGAITNWNRGRLQRDPPLGSAQLCPPETEASAEPGYPAGDTEFDSNHPWVLAHPPLVCEFSVNLAPEPVP
jgi:hypothetical protein